ncbi:MAG TPA: hypothetical protein VN651_20205 [Gemmatimonadaceae bacterium]|nr:hypothetical protein [Gemmatimonadaceae bacterium]
MALNLQALTFIVVFGTPCFSQVSPPKAPIRPVTDDYFGTKVVDNYRYFENLKDPGVQQWMKAQADYARHVDSELSHELSHAHPEPSTLA